MLRNFVNHEKHVVELSESLCIIGMIKNRHHRRYLLSASSSLLEIRKNRALNYYRHQIKLRGGSVRNLGASASFNSRVQCVQGVRHLENLQLQVLEFLQCDSRTTKSTTTSSDDDNDDEKEGFFSESKGTTHNTQHRRRRFQVSREERLLLVCERHLY